MGGEPPQPSPCAANIRGGSQAVTAARDSRPGPKIIVTATGLPSRSSNSVGTNQDEMPGPVAMACQTSSGVPGTSTSTWMDRRPDGSFFTLMTAPWDRISAAEGALGGATPPTLLGRRRTNNHRSAAGGRERHGVAGRGLVDQARGLRPRECGRALPVNPARLAGPLQQFPRIGEWLQGSSQARWIDVEGASPLARPEVACLIDEALARNPVPF